jgi:hypothetical protein
MIVQLAYASGRHLFLWSKREKNILSINNKNIVMAIDFKNQLKKV